MKVFPVRGPSTFAREFNPPRHNGVDIFAELGTPVVAPEDGHVKLGQDPAGGLVFNLTTAGGWRYYGAHLDRQQGQDRFVQAGEIIGYVGRSGNARGTQPHLHFEVHPPDAAPLDPYPLLNETAGVDAKREAAYAKPPAAAPAPVPAAAPAAAAPPQQAGGDWLKWIALAWLLRKAKVL